MRSHSSLGHFPAELQGLPPGEAVLLLLCLTGPALRDQGEAQLLDVLDLLFDDLPQEGVQVDGERHEDLDVSEFSLAWRGRRRASSCLGRTQ